MEFCLFIKKAIRDGTALQTFNTADTTAYMRTYNAIWWERFSGWEGWNHIPKTVMTTRTPAVLKNFESPDDTESYPCRFAEREWQLLLLVELPACLGNTYTLYNTTCLGQLTIPYNAICWGNTNTIFPRQVFRLKVAHGILGIVRGLGAYLTRWLFWSLT